MKLLHIADLHIGKRLNEFNLLEDQEHILRQILRIAAETEADATLIAGDVYDKSQPSAEAVALLDRFLTELVSLGKPVLMISGNHDSPERLGFGSRILDQKGLHIAGRFKGALEKITLRDEHGVVHVYLLPFIKPATVRPYLAEAAENYDAAVRAALSFAEVDQQERNVLVAHQFVTAAGLEPLRSESEAINVGGLDNVDASAFAAFDYVALGHLHRAQNVGERIRYAGSPLKYSFSEALQGKSVTLVELGAKGEMAQDAIPLVPLRDLREIRGPLAELLRLGRESGDAALDYIRAVLTDEEAIYDALGQMRQVFPNLMALEFDNRRSKTRDDVVSVPTGIKSKTSLELFADFYALQNGVELDEEEIALLTELFNEAGGERE